MKTGPSGEHLPLKDVDFGAIFLNECSKFEYGQGEKEKAKVLDVKNRAWAFMLKMVEETEKRLPDNLEVFDKLNALKPESVILGDTNFASLGFSNMVDAEEIETLEHQWRLLSQVEWSETNLFRDAEIPQDPVEFWSRVRDYRGNSMIEGSEDENNNGMFLEIANFALGKLTIAHSTATVERIFSIVSCVKTKVRNRMKVDTLEAILRIRTYLHNQEKCCKSLVVSDKMLRLFKSDMYSSESNKYKDQDDNFNEALVFIPSM